MLNDFDPNWYNDNIFLYITNYVLCSYKHDTHIIILLQYNNNNLRSPKRLHTRTKFFQANAHNFPWPQNNRRNIYKIICAATLNWVQNIHKFRIYLYVVYTHIHTYIRFPLLSNAFIHFYLKRPVVDTFLHLSFKTAKNVYNLLRFAYISQSVPYTTHTLYRT